ncbi:epoxide hydrolase 1 [Jeotgalicoccus huakuii]|uniref:epoxide hydrolase family protein n=1 Tax=Jeotgalicoccus marinus TaxID=516700 RepID=UPI00041097E7|nr:epoxide hydrolase [Jeotgalicoccus marinus]MCK1977389.1 epoxide hydrolase 1 [Jeotgalicoccus huakuii]
MSKQSVREFEISISEGALEDLHYRLNHARFPEAETVPNDAKGKARWRQGVPLKEMIELVDYWKNEYDWRKFEKKINQFQNYKTVIDGVDIHFIHMASTRKNAVPLIISHGWPGSVVEFLDIIKALCEPECKEDPAFHVVVPSLPGFGFSERPSVEGIGTEKIASIWVQLMQRLGYNKFLAHGGDWGGVITTQLAGLYPKNIIGIHSTFNQAPPGMSLDVLSEKDKIWAENSFNFWGNKAAYAKVQSSQPQTIGYALVDSPTGQLAWILDKFFEWTDTTNSPYERISKDHILDNVTLYYLTRTAASSARIYYESHDAIDPELTVDVPTALTLYPKDIEKYPRVWAEKRYRNIVAWNEAPEGGHFPSLEVSEYFVKDLRNGLSSILEVYK